MSEYVAENTNTTRMVPMSSEQRRHLTQMGTLADRHRFPVLVQACDDIADAWDAAPADTEETVRDTLNGYLPIADTYPATEEVLCALRFYDGSMPDDPGFTAPVSGVYAFGNRWLAFTDDELTTLKRCLRSGSPHGALLAKVEAELERRNAS